MSVEMSTNKQFEILLALWAWVACNSQNLQPYINLKQGFRTFFLSIPPRVFFFNLGDYIKDLNAYKTALKLLVFLF